ncbi:MAG: NrfD/PsrC family molybdoenzyme membrane anchor subunit [Thermoguttaceae bacterium]
MTRDRPGAGPAGRARMIGYLALGVAGALGAGATVVRFRDGLMVTHLTQHVPWGLWIALYIYFIGLSAGAFLLSTLIYVFGMRRLEAAGPTALIQALGCMLVALLLIFVDLGHPERFLNVFLYWNPSSVLAWECLFYTAYLAVILAELFLLLRARLARRAQQRTPWAPLYRLLALGSKVPDHAWQGAAARWVRVLGLAGIPVAIGVHGGTGAIFAVAKARPNWFSGLFPIIFLVSALASGGGLLTLLTPRSAGCRAPPNTRWSGTWHL